MILDIFDIWSLGISNIFHFFVQVYFEDFPKNEINWYDMYKYQLCHKIHNAIIPYIVENFLINIHCTF